MGSDSEVVLVIGNPNAGDGSGIEVLEKHVLPLLKAANISYDYHTTTTAQHAAELARQHLVGSAAPIILAGGDGTVHDILNSVFLDCLAPTDAHPTRATKTLSLILVPTGTANAMYASFYPPSAPDMISHPLLPQDIPLDVAYKLQSVLSFVEKKAPPSPLFIAFAQIYPASSYCTSNEVPSSCIVSCVVASTSMHAGILHSAEKLRSTIPGLERFKVAARENILQWSNARVELLPALGRDSVLEYDPVQKRLVPCAGPGSVSLDGPFFYFLSTINVDRLEPQFVITPLVRTSPSAANEGALDVVVLRPARKFKYRDNTTEERAALAQIAVEWFGQVYQGGEHIHYTYPGEDNSNLVYMTEYFRVGGWVWHPEGNDEFSRRICLDGTVLQVPEGGHLEVKIPPPEETRRVDIWI